jgi:uncharacterized metal-binding protein
MNRCPKCGKKNCSCGAKGALAKKKVEKVMGEYKRGTLHSGKGGPVVKKRDQAVAIAMSEARRRNGSK